MIKETHKVNKTLVIQFLFCYFSLHRPTWIGVPGEYNRKQNLKQNLVLHPQGALGYLKLIMIVIEGPDGDWVQLEKQTICIGTFLKLCLSP